MSPDDEQQHLDNLFRFREECENLIERGFDPQQLFEHSSADYEEKMARVFGIKIGVIVIGISYLLIVCSQILAGFMSVHLELDAVITGTTTTALSGLLGFSLGRKKNGK